MKKTTFNINENHFLSDVFKMLPSNSIIRKNVTGIGATTLEIKSHRNSIIVLPNLPVIHQKAKKHDGVLGVHGNVTTLDIVQYLLNTELPYKKILITPESFYKVIDAFEREGINYKEDYFLLFDECDKICKDFSFRKTITLPMNYFFSFKNKAIISATALIPRDPRFESQSFEIVDIVPNYNIETNMKLYKTNNASYVFNYLVCENTRKKTYFIFCNSINLITHIINKKGIGSESSIFCSETTAERIIKSSFNHVGSKMDESKLSTYNFLTSRFYSALDIEYSSDVEIIILSDLAIAEHTIIDPQTDAIQIIGRFRDKKINKSVTIISTEDKDLISFNEETCLRIIDCQRSIYETMKDFSKTISSTDSTEIFQELVESLDYNNFLNKNGSLNYFALDSYIYRHSLNILYKDFSNLKARYESLCIIDTDLHFFKIIDFQTLNSRIPSYSEQLLFTRGKKYKAIIKEVMQILDSLENTNKYEFTLSNEFRDDLKRTHFEIVQAYDLIDHNLLKVIENPTELKRETMKALNLKIHSNFPFLRDLQAEFILGEKLTTDEIIMRFKTCIDKHSLTMNATLKNVKKFIVLKRCQLRNKGYGYRISDYINNN